MLRNATRSFAKAATTARRPAAIRPAGKRTYATEADEGLLSGPVNFSLSEDQLAYQGRPLLDMSLKDGAERVDLQSSPGGSPPRTSSPSRQSTTAPWSASLPTSESLDG